MDYAPLIGKRLVDHVLNHNGVTLIPAGIVLEAKHIDILENFQIDLDQVLTEEITETVKSEEGVASTSGQLEDQHTRELITQAERGMQQIERYILDKGKIPVHELKDHVLPSIREASRQRNLYKLFSHLKSEGDFRYRHAVGVSIIATMIGRWMKLDRNDMFLLTLAATLYDIGLVKVPNKLLHKPTWLEPHELEIVKHHAIWGYELLKESDVDERVAQVALQHHERSDGSGYPNGTKGDQIHLFSKIISLADAYMAMTSDRPHRKAFRTQDAIRHIYEDTHKGKYDTDVAMTFLNRLMNAQLGSEVILSDGRTGKILVNDPNDPYCPLIALENTVVDLRKEKQVTIREIVG